MSRFGIGLLRSLQKALGRRTCARLSGPAVMRAGDRGPEWESPVKEELGDRLCTGWCVIYPLGIGELRQNSSLQAQESPRWQSIRRGKSEDTVNTEAARRVEGR